MFGRNFSRDIFSIVVRAMIYVVIYDNIDRIEDELERLGIILKEIFDQPFHILPEFHFAETTGLSNFVFDEIELVLSQKLLSTEDFAKKWGITQYLDRELSSLSVGWRKFLIAALTIEVAPRDSGLLLQGLTHYLDDDLISRVVREMGAQPDRSYILVDWDVALVPDVPGGWAAIIVNGECGEAEHSNSNMSLERLNDASFCEKHFVSI